jgi:signal peptidase II
MVAPYVSILLKKHAILESMGLLRTAIVRRSFGAGRIIAYCTVLLANYAADRITKVLAVHFLKGAPHLSFFDGLAVLTYAENTGAFLSLGAHWPPPIKGLLFIVLPLVACGAGLFFAFRKTTEPSEAVAALCIIGGGLGNLQDRLINDGRVVDFMNFGIGQIRTGILNVSDLSVTFGALALLFFVYRNESNRGKASQDGK